ncbi:MAG: hypothetical protein R8M38_01475 [Mariprofundaceae bacterium]
MPLTKTIKTILFIAGLTFAFSASAADIMVSASIPFAKNASVRDAVRNECQLETKLPHFIQEYAVKNDLNVELTSDKLNKKRGQTLFVEITHVHASGGGAFSGPKSVSVAGKLFKKGKVVASFTGSRYSSGGMWAGFKGTCSITGRCVKTLGSDIAKWLKNPVDGANLGDG